MKLLRLSLPLALLDDIFALAQTISQNVGDVLTATTATHLVILDNDRVLVSM